jgi:hypothetical protein
MYHWYDHGFVAIVAVLFYDGTTDHGLEHDGK